MSQPRRGVPPLKSMPQHPPLRRGLWPAFKAHRVYALRELTSLAVLYYAVLLIVALHRLLAGEAAFAQFMTALRAPGWVALNLLALAGMVFHAWTWFGVLPKTAPFLFWRGQRVADAWLVRGGLLAWALCTLAVLVFFMAGRS